MPKNPRLTRSPGAGVDWFGGAGNGRLRKWTFGWPPAPHSQTSAAHPDVRSGVLLSKEDLPEATKQLEEAAAQSTKNSADHDRFGQPLSVGPGQVSKAEQAYLQAASMDPNNVNRTRVWVGCMCGWESGQRRRDFRKLAQMKPDDPPDSRIGGQLLHGPAPLAPGHRGIRASAGRRIPMTSTTEPVWPRPICFPDSTPKPRHWSMP